MSAQMALIQCQFNHTHCNRTPFLKSPGQNLALLRSSAVIAPEDAIMSAVHGWWGEHNNITAIGSELKYDKDEIKSTADYGHFTVMAGNRANRMGCATMSMYSGKVFITACNYGNNNFEDEPIYKYIKNTKSNLPGHKCKTKSTYKGLCGPQEDYSHYTECHTTNKMESKPVQQWRNNERMLDFLNAQLPLEKRITPSEELQPLEPIVTQTKHKMESISYDPNNPESLKKAKLQMKAQMILNLKDYLENKDAKPPQANYVINGKKHTFKSPKELRDWLDEEYGK